VYPLKPLSREAVPQALEKAAHYRGLNEPLEAESICRDVLAVDADNRAALITLFLSLTDQLAQGHADAFEHARELLPRLGDAYSRAYYAGILHERRAKARLAQGGIGSGALVHGWLVAAMELFDAAARLRPPGNDDAILRWNTCARILNAHPALRPESDEPISDMLE
jgi:hypothetical protein